MVGLEKLRIFYLAPDLKGHDEVIHDIATTDRLLILTNNAKSIFSVSRKGLFIVPVHPQDERLKVTIDGPLFDCEHQRLADPLSLAGCVHIKLIELAFRRITNRGMGESPENLALSSQLDQITALQLFLKHISSVALSQHVFNLTLRHHVGIRLMPNPFRKDSNCLNVFHCGCLVLDRLRHRFHSKKIRPYDLRLRMPNMCSS